MDELNIQTQKEKLLSQQNQLQNDSQKQQKNSKRGCSPDSSNPESDFENLDSEIKLVVENEKDISFLSNSNSGIYEQQSNIDQLLNYKHWGIRKESPKTISPNKIYFKDISLKNKIFLFNEQKIHKPFHSKYASNNPEYNEGCESCNNKSTKSDEDSETRTERFHNITENDVCNDDNDFLCESNKYNFKENNNKSNTNENFEKEKKIKINNTHKEKDNINNNAKPKKKTIEEKVKEKILSNFYGNSSNNNNISNNSNNIIKPNIFMSSFNYSASSSNCDQMNYASQTKNCLSPFFQRTYLPPPIYPIMPNYNNYQSNLTKRNIMPTTNISIKNANNENEIKNNENDEEKYLIKKENEKNEKQNKFNNNIYNFNEKIRKNSIDVASLVINQNNNPNLVRYQKMNLNMVYYPPIQIKLQNAASQKLIQQNNNVNIMNENNSSENITKNLQEINKNKEDSPKDNIIKNSMKEKDEKKLNNDNSKSNNNLSNNKTQKQKINSLINANNNSTSNKNCTNLNKANNTSIINNSINSSNLIQNNNNPLYKGEKQVLNLDDIVTGKDTRTTVMIRNIPIKYTDDILIEALKEFSGKYDCLYMPYDFENNGNKGYAFINFVNPLHILYFYEKFSGKKWVLFESSKICELNVAYFQGINEIQKHAKNYKGYKKFNDREKSDNLIIPSKYLMKLKKRFPKMVYSENKLKKIIVVKSLE